MRSGGRADDHGLFKTSTLRLVQTDFVLADLDRVVVLEQLLFDGLAIDIGAVGAVEVFNVNVSPRHLEHGVFTAHSQVVNDHIVVWTTTQVVRSFVNCTSLITTPSIETIIFGMADSILFFSCAQKGQALRKIREKNP